MSVSRRGVLTLKGWFRPRNLRQAGPHVITYRATLDVPAETVRIVSASLLAHRKAHDARPWQRAATPYVQAIMVLRWFKEATDLRVLARDAAVSTATAYRYLHEAIDVIAAHAPELPDVLAEALQQGWTFVCLDGTLIASTRSAAPSEAGHDLWYSGKPSSMAGTSRSSPAPPATPSGSATSSPARPTTSPPPAHMPSQSSIEPPPEDCRP